MDSHSTPPTPGSPMKNLFTSRLRAGSKARRCQVPPRARVRWLRLEPLENRLALSLVAAYSFDQGAGTTVADASGIGNTGTISGATWTTSGKFGNALSFNGTSARV